MKHVCIASEHVQEIDDFVANPKNDIKFVAGSMWGGLGVVHIFYKKKG